MASKAVAKKAKKKAFSLTLASSETFSGEKSMMDCEMSKIGESVAQISAVQIRESRGALAKTFESHRREQILRIRRYSIRDS